MSPAVVTAVVKALFDELEKRFAGRPVVLILLHSLEAVAATLIPVLVAKADEAATAEANAR
jgi:hypothetical protein